MFRLRDSNLSLFIFLKLPKETIENFVAWDGNNAWIWCHNIDPTCETNIMSLLNFFTTLRQRKCHHAPLNKLHLTFFKKLTQCYCNAMLMLRKCFGFDAAVSTLYLHSYYNIHYIMWGEDIIQCWGTVGTTL